jgi:hypothetical protein
MIKCLSNAEARQAYSKATRNCFLLLERIETADLVSLFNANQTTFFESFTASMIKVNLIGFVTRLDN